MVVYFNLGVAGASSATVIAQVATCIVTYIYVQVKISILRLGLKDMIVKKSLLIRTFKDGLITGIQQSVPPLGKTLILAKVNYQFHFYEYLSLQQYL